MAHSSLLLIVLSRGPVISRARPIRGVFDGDLGHWGIGEQFEGWRKVGRQNQEYVVTHNAYLVLLTPSLAPHDPGPSARP